ncbi:hypothetical protein FACS189432_01410 [Bacteroidia bacterium]|nr:hypothetical protein FACS189432_01410 [Bacteroidia bacterium]
MKKVKFLVIRCCLFLNFNKRITIAALLLVLVQGAIFAQKKGVTSVSASVNANQGALLLDNNSQTAWELKSKDLQNNQFLMFTLQKPGDVKEIQLEANGISKEEIQKAISLFITYDPMNLGEAVKYNIQGNQKFSLTFPPKYGAHVQITIKGNTPKNMENGDWTLLHNCITRKWRLMPIWECRTFIGYRSVMWNVILPPQRHGNWTLLIWIWVWKLPLI